MLPALQILPRKTDGSLQLELSEEILIKCYLQRFRQDIGKLEAVANPPAPLRLVKAAIATIARSEGTRKGRCSWNWVGLGGNSFLIEAEAFGGGPRDLTSLASFWSPEGVSHQPCPAGSWWFMLFTDISFKA